MSEALVIRNDAERSLSFTGEALKLKETAMDAAAMIGRVSDAIENTAATEAQLGIARLLKTVESVRVEVKAPVLAFERKIDETAKAFVAELKVEEMRLAKLVGDFHQLQEAKRQAAEKAARLEVERIERERLAEENRIRREQWEREQAENKARLEAERKIREANSAKEREAAERAAVELKRQQELAAARSHDELDAAQERASQAQAAIVHAPVFEAPKAKGQVIKTKKAFDVQDIHALYRSHPNCVKLEPLLSEIQSLVDNGIIPKGIGNVREETKASVRVGRERTAIDI